MGSYSPGAGLKWVKKYGKGPDVIDAMVNRSTYTLGAYNPADYAGPTPETFELTPFDQVWPETNRVGVISADTLTSINEGLGTSQVWTFQTPGQIINNTVMAANASIKAAGLVFQNCLFLGPPTIEKQVVTATNAGANPILFIDCTFVPQNPNRWASGWIGSTGATRFLRCDFYGQSDALTPGGAWTNGVTADQCAFHDMIQYAPDPGAAGGIDDAQTHVDQVQFVSGSTFIGRGCGFRGYFTANTRYMEANQPPKNFGGTPLNPTYHWFGNRAWPSLRTTSNIMMSPATSLDVFEISDSFLEGATSPVNCAGVAQITGRFDFLRNTIENTGSLKTILAKAVIQPQINCVGNKTFGGVPLSKADLIQNGG